MKTSYTIQNLKCGGCAHTIYTKLTALPNVSNVEIHVDSSSVSFNHTTNEVLTEVKKTLRVIGYPIEGDPNSVLSKAKSFVSCASGKFSKN